MEEVKSWSTPKAASSSHHGELMRSSIDFVYPLRLPEVLLAYATLQKMCDLLRDRIHFVKYA
jgi:hypothetical protein